MLGPGIVGEERGRPIDAPGAHGIRIEISPLFAMDAQQVAEMIDPGRTFERSEYLTGE